MAKRGRKSAADLGTLTVIQVKRPPPPSELTEAEKIAWRDVVGSMPADWFRRAQFPVLIEYCRHTARAALMAAQVAAFKPEWLSEEGGLQRFDRLLAMAERETRAVLACARSLRITNQSQMRATAAGSQVSASPDGTRPWE